MVDSSSNPVSNLPPGRCLLRRAIARLVLMFIVTTAFAATGFAQSQATTGVIEGTVSDETGGRLPGATVTLVNHGHQLHARAGHRRRRPLPRPAAAARRLRADGHAQRVRHDTSRRASSSAWVRRLNLPITLRLSSVSQEVRGHRRLADRRDHAGREPTQINEESIADLPNNGRNFLSFMQLTPGVTIVQGPDGDEISINGQKGINNNISVDGADFNNPFFGEQRGGQRPAFTFNQDAIQEMVVVADGAAAEFGRSGAGLRQRRDQVGHEHARPGRRTFFFKDDAPVVGELGRARSSRSISSSSARRFGGPIKRDKMFFLLRLRPAAVRPDQAARSRAHRTARRRPLRGARQPRRERARSTAPTTRACSSARSTTS